MGHTLKRFLVAAFALCAAVAGFAQNPTYKTGADLTPSGTPGVDSAFEYFYSDPLVSDRCVIYTRDTTTWTPSLNARHIVWLDGNNINGLWANATGTFLDTETVTQAGTGATRKVIRDQNAASNFGSYLLVRAGGATGSPNGSGIWTGQTSGATWTPTNVPQNGVGQYYTWGATDSWTIFRGYADMDLNYSSLQFANNGASVYPVLGAFTFATLPTFPGGESVVGNTGARPGAALTAANRTTYYWRGIAGADGNEYHTITSASDNNNNPGVSTNPEYRASDGKIRVFVVNPKTPCLQITVTGNAQFHTSAIKAYYQPKVYTNQQTEFFDLLGGTISFAMVDLYGTPCHYRINGGTWTTYSTPLTSSSFSTGSNTLDYYDDGFGSTSVFKTRVVLKNPIDPSLADGPYLPGGQHGTAFLIPPDTWTTIITRLTTSGTPQKVWYDNYSTDTSNNARPIIEANCMQGKRLPYAEGQATLSCASINAIQAMKQGTPTSPNWTFVPSGSTWNLGRYFKSYVLDNNTGIDSVGMQKNQEGQALGSREDIERGYYDCLTKMDMVLGYDIMCFNFRWDQFTGGMTPIESYYIRECIARDINEQIFNSNMGETDIVSSTFMWSTARNIYALGATYIIPTYTGTFGTNGIDGNTSTTTMNPFPDIGYTFKQVLIGNNQPLTAFPNYYKRLGLEETLYNATGEWDDKISYSNGSLMGRVLPFGVIMARKFNPEIQWPHYDLGLFRAAVGNGVGLGSGTEGWAHWTLLMTYNNLFRYSGPTGQAWTNTQASNPTENAGTRMFNCQCWGLIDWQYLLTTSAGQPQPSSAILATP